MMIKIHKRLKDCLTVVAVFLLMTANAQQSLVKVTGKVVDESGVPLTGVSIIVRGGTGGTVTNVQGNYELTVPSTSTLIFTHLGFTDQVFRVTPSGMLNVTMTKSIEELEELVVVGYGTQKKKDLTGGVATVGSNELSMVSTSNLMDRLTGQVAGLSITTGNASPGSGQTLLIRGQNSITASNDPLIVLNGIPYDGSLVDIDPNIVDNLTVLKDASAVAIYGSRGSNGVILIQTKKGAKGKTQVTYKSQIGIAEPMQRIQVMGPNEYIRFKQDMARLGKNAYSGVQLDPLEGLILSTEEKENYAKGVTHNWQDYIFRTAFTMDHQVSISGGSESTTYMASVSRTDQDGVVHNSKLVRDNVSLNVSQIFNNWLTMGTTVMYMQKETGGITPNIEHAVKQSPYGKYRDDTGRYYEKPMSSDLIINPMANVDADQDNTTRNVILNGFAEIKLPVDGLSAKSQFGYNYRNNFTGTYYGRNTADGRKVNGKASVSNSNYTDWTWENILQYDRTFLRDHRVSATGLFSLQETVTKSSSQSGESFVNDDSSYHNMSGAEKNVTISSGFSKKTLESMMFRVNYAYKDKYLATVTGRRDGASVFGKNNKYAFFPSVALAWQIADEHFVKDNVQWIDMLKLRASYGANGNQAISSYQTLDRLYSNSQVKYPWGDGSAPSGSAYLPNDGVGNPDLKWETTYTVNLGLDFRFFNGRLNGSVDVYHSNTKDLLMRRTLPIMNGYRTIMYNIGKTRNKGIEVTLNTNNIRTNDFSWSTDLNFFMNRDEIVDLRGDKVDDVANNWFIGKPLSVFYDYKVTGIWQEGDQFYYTDNGVEKEIQQGAAPGAAKLKDVNKNGYIDSDDREIIGSKKPSFTMSMGNKLRYKDFHLSFLINGTFGTWREDNVANISSWTFGYTNYIRGVKYWTPETPDADVVSPGYSASFSHTYYKELTYVQIKNVTLGYNFNKNLVNKLGLSAVSVELSVNNLHTFSNMRQMLNYDASWMGVYPTARSYVLGLNVNF